MSEKYITGFIVLGFIALSLSIVALLFIIASNRRRNSLYKKADYLVEDLTYKSEMLNSTVETVSKIANYVDVFEVVARKNIKSSAKLFARNKDDIYKILDRLKKIAMGEQSAPSDTKTTKIKVRPDNKTEGGK